MIWNYKKLLKNIIGPQSNTKYDTDFIHNKNSAVIDDDSVVLFREFSDLFNNFKVIQYDSIENILAIIKMLSVIVRKWYFEIQFKKFKQLDKHHKDVFLASLFYFKDTQN